MVSGGRVVLGDGVFADPGPVGFFVARHGVSGPGPLREAVPA